MLASKTFHRRRPLRLSVCLGMAGSRAGLTPAAGAPREPVPKPVLQVIFTNAGTSQSVTRAELEKRLSPAQVTVMSPVYGHPITYQGFWLDQVLRSLHIDAAEQEIQFQCADGFGAALM